LEGVNVVNPVGLKFCGLECIAVAPGEDREIVVTARCSEGKFLVCVGRYETWYSLPRFERIYEGTESPLKRFLESVWHAHRYSGYKIEPQAPKVSR
jgi:hypothetical protein